METAAQKLTGDTGAQQIAVVEFSMDLPQEPSPRPVSSAPERCTDLLHFAQAPARRPRRADASTRTRSSTAPPTRQTAKRASTNIATMWKTAAILSLLANALLTTIIVFHSRGRTKVIRGELVVPMIDVAPAFDAKAQNTRLIGIKTESGEHQTCRVATPA